MHLKLIPLLKESTRSDPAVKAHLRATSLALPPTIGAKIRDLIDEGNLGRKEGRLSVLDDSRALHIV